MKDKRGILLVSHVEEIAEGLLQLLQQVAGEVSIRTAGGTEEHGIGTSFDKITATLEEFEEEKIIAFYDLGSARMNLEMAVEVSEKKVQISRTAFLEGAYVAASLLQVGVAWEEIEKQLEPLILEKK